MSKKNRKGGISLEKELDDIFSILSSHIEKVENKKTKKIGKKRGRPPKNPCRALIPLDTAKIRRGYLKEYKRRKKVLERLEEQLQRYEKKSLKGWRSNFNGMKNQTSRSTVNILLARSVRNKPFYAS